MQKEVMLCIAIQVVEETIKAVEEGSLKNFNYKLGLFFY